MGYKSDAQRKAVHASKNEAAGKMKHGSHAKMYDSPGKMYKDGAGKMKEHTLKKTSKPAPDTKGVKTERARSLKKTSKPAPNSMSRELTYGGPVIDQMGNALSHMGAMKVLKHSKSRF